MSFTPFISWTRTLRPVKSGRALLSGLVFIAFASPAFAAESKAEVDTTQAEPTTAPSPSRKNDELTTAALKRAHRAEAKRQKTAAKASAEAGAADPALEESGPIITNPVVKSEPAPGTELTTQKARELIMTSQHVVDDNQGEGSVAAEAHAEATEAQAASACAHAPSKPEGLINVPLIAPVENIPEPITTRESERQAAKNAAPTNPPVVPSSAAKVGAHAIRPPGDPHATAEAATPPPAHSATSESPATAGPAPVETAIPTPKNVSAAQSEKWLTNGNLRFVKKHFRADGRTDKDRERIWKTGQKPHAIVLSCSDSVVPPEIVFDQALGEIFVIRTLGEVADASTLASIEYAIEYLGPQLLVVMGHTKCDAVEGAVQLKESDNAGSEFLNKLLADIRGHLRTVKTEKPSPNLQIESTLNADGVARDLVKRSEIIRKKVDAGQLVIKTALYRGENGKVVFY